MTIVFQAAQFINNFTGLRSRFQPRFPPLPCFCGDFSSPFYFLLYQSLLTPHLIVSQGCRNKSSQTCWHKAMESYSHTVGEAELPPELGEQCVVHPSPGFLGLPGCLGSLACSCITPHCASVLRLLSWVSFLLRLCSWDPCHWV